MNTLPIQTVDYTVSEFLAWYAQQNTDEKFELINGLITAVPDATPAHGNIINNCNCLFGNHLFHSACYVYAHTLCKIDDKNCLQPDLLLVDNLSVESHLLENPMIVGEILSPNKKNLMDKLMCYQHCGSIQEIFMIEQDKMAITVHKRTNENKWTQKQYDSPNDVIVIDSIDFSIKMTDIYHKTKFYPTGKYP